MTASRVVVTLLTIVAFFLPVRADAELISLDWMTTGDGLITQDTVNGLEWLDVTQSVNRSFNDVSSQFDVGGAFEGFRYATLAEWEDFIGEAGIPCCGGSSTRFDPVQALQDLIGVTFLTSNSLLIEAVTDGLLDHGTATLDATTLLNPQGPFGVFPTTGSASHSSAPSPDSVSPFTGSWLVRVAGSGTTPTSVPEPSTFTLLGMGFATALGLRRRR